MKKNFERSMTVITCIVLGMGLNSCDVLMKAAEVSNALATPTTPVMTVETPGKRMVVQAQNVELIENGKQVMVSFLLTNRGQDISDYSLGRDYEEMVAYDNLGTKATVYLVWGEKNTWASGSNIRASLPGNTPVLIKAIIFNFNPQATHFTQIKFFGYCHGYNELCEGAKGAYIFKNVQIPRQ